MTFETNDQRYLRLAWTNDDVFRRSITTLAHNLAVAAFGAAMFKAGDNFGFHMGADESQCTCQWAPNVNGEPYKGWTRCEQDDFYDEPEPELDDFDYEWPADVPIPGPNGCTCGFNGDCNCRFAP